MSQRQVAFTTDKNGRPVAYRYSVAAGGRWFRMSYAAAEVEVATGAARQVRFVTARTAARDAGR